LEPDKKHELQRLYEIYRTLKRPTGYSKTCEDIDVDIHEYDTYISGLISSYLSGVILEEKDVDLGKDIEQKLEVCELKLQELRTFWFYQRRLAEMLTNLFTEK